MIMKWNIKFTPYARRSLNKLDPQIARRIKNFLHLRVASLEDPRSISKNMKGLDAKRVRYRVGDYRVVVEIKDYELLVLVVSVGHRSVVYRKP